MSHPRTFSARRRAVAAGIAVMGLLVVAAAVWLVADARAAQRHLTAARASAAAMVTAVRHGDVDGADADARRLRSNANAARHETDGWLWNAVGSVPYLGRTPRAIRVISEVTAQLADDTVPSLLTLQRSLQRDPPAEGGHVDLVRMRVVGETVQTAARELGRQRPRLDGLRTGGVLPVVRRAVKSAQLSFAGIDRDIADAAAVLRATPDLLGGNGRRRYLVVLQNDAESRGTGGIAGAYLTLAADGGRLRVVASGTDDDFDATRAPVDVLGSDYASLYGVDPALWANANVSPHFPDAARLWLADWQQVHGGEIDGVIALDPTVLARLLTVTGPVQVPPVGALQARDAVAVTERDVYRRFADNTTRKRFLLDVMHRVADRLLNAGSGDVPAMLRALGSAADDGRLMAFAVNGNEQHLMEHLGWSGELPATNAPYLRVSVVNAAGNKLDYYLRRRVTYALTECRGGTRATTVTVGLTNAVPRGPLPPYVVGRHPPLVAGHATPGANRLLLYLHLTRGAGLQNAELDGRRTAVGAGTERGHPVLVLMVEFEPGQTRTLVLHLVEPAATGQPTVAVQPLVTPQETTVIGGSCRPGV